MLSKQPNLAGRLAFILLCFLDLGLVRTVPLLRRSAVSPQSDEFIESDTFILETYKNKLEEMDAKNLKSHAPTHKLLGTDSDKTSVSKVSNHDEIYLEELAQLKVENEALKKELAGLEQKTDLDNQNEEVITDNDLNYPVLPDTPKLLDSVIERKRGTWHTLDLDDDEPPKEQERLEQAGNPSFGHVGIGRTNLSPDAEKIISTDTVNKENVNEKSSNQEYPVFKAVATATGDDKIEVERGRDEKKTASTDVVTLTVAAIALLCAAVFIVFTAVQWRKTLKAIKIDQMKSNQSLKSMRNEIKKMTSMSSINIKNSRNL
ncbi:uncharacterized protein LOC134812817 [Bolinopsis microptera]|uniref:uncharacterized protein LOC134812817 n=1 Tax=Bolinopsis microptera TaxID=2820187 RepID=UPI00307A5C3E